MTKVNLNKKNRSLNLNLEPFKQLAALLDGPNTDSNYLLIAKTVTANSSKLKIELKITAHDITLFDHSGATMPTYKLDLNTKALTVNDTPATEQDTQAFVKYATLIGTSLNESSAQVFSKSPAANSASTSDTANNQVSLDELDTISGGALPAVDLTHQSSVSFDLLRNSALIEPEHQHNTSQFVALSHTTPEYTQIQKALTGKLLTFEPVSPLQTQSKDWVKALKFIIKNEDPKVGFEKIQSLYDAAQDRDAIFTALKEAIVRFLHMKSKNRTRVITTLINLQENQFPMIQQAYLEIVQDIIPIPNSTMMDPAFFETPKNPLKPVVKTYNDTCKKYDTIHKQFKKVKAQLKPSNQRKLDALIDDANTLLNTVRSTIESLSEPNSPIENLLLDALQRQSADLTSELDDMSNANQNFGQRDLYKKAAKLSRVFQSEQKLQEYLEQAPPSPKDEDVDVFVHAMLKTDNIHMLRKQLIQSSSTPIVQKALFSTNRNSYKLVRQTEEFGLMLAFKLKEMETEPTLKKDANLLRRKVLNRLTSSLPSNCLNTEELKLLVTVKPWEMALENKQTAQKIQDILDAHNDFPLIISADYIREWFTSKPISAITKPILIEALTLYNGYFDTQIEIEIQNKTELESRIADFRDNKEWRRINKKALRLRNAQTELTHLIAKIKAHPVGSATDDALQKVKDQHNVLAKLDQVSGLSRIAKITDTFNTQYTNI